MKIIALNITMLLCMAAHSQGIKDSLFFNNGSLVIGEIKRVKLGVVTFDPDDANDITVQLRKLKTIAAGKRIFRIETIDHHLYFGTIGLHPASDTINILKGEKDQWFRPADVCVAPDGSLIVADWYDPGVGGIWEIWQQSGRCAVEARGGNHVVGKWRTRERIVDGRGSCTESLR